VFLDFREALKAVDGDDLRERVAARRRLSSGSCGAAASPECAICDRPCSAAWVLLAHHVGARRDHAGAVDVVENESKIVVA
jgi:hypothetical protein